jgi:anaerobic selenocysteine-containing dehydrogenase
MRVAHTAARQIAAAVPVRASFHRDANPDYDDDMRTAPNDGPHLRTCSLCEAMCGIDVQVEDGRVARRAT